MLAKRLCTEKPLVPTQFLQRTHIRQVCSQKISEFEKSEIQRSNVRNRVILSTRAGCLNRAYIRGNADLGFLNQRKKNSKATCTTLMLLWHRIPTLCNGRAARLGFLEFKPTLCWKMVQHIAGVSTLTWKYNDLESVLHSHCIPYPIPMYYLIFQKLQSLSLTQFFCTSIRSIRCRSYYLSLNLFWLLDRKMDGITVVNHSYKVVTGSAVLCN